VKAGESVEMELSEDGSRFYITLHGKAKRKFTLPVLDLGGAELPVPKIPFTATAKVLAEVFASAVDDASAFSTHATIHITNDSFSVKASGSKGEYVLELKLGEHDALLDLQVSEEARASYPLDYLSDMVSQANKTAALTIALSTDAPLKLAYSIGDANFTYFLAPRIETG
jgi:proliferating cell nuclear antigen